MFDKLDFPGEVSAPSDARHTIHQRVQQRRRHRYQAGGTAATLAAVVAVGVGITTFGGNPGGSDTAVPPAGSAPAPTPTGTGRAAQVTPTPGTGGPTDTFVTRDNGFDICTPAVAFPGVALPGVVNIVKGTSCGEAVGATRAWVAGNGKVGITYGGFSCLSGDTGKGEVFLLTCVGGKGGKAAEKSFTVFRTT